MSGGHFTNNGYDYYKVHQFADELENDIAHNENPNEYQYAPRFKEETLSYMRKQVISLRKTAQIMRAIDYLYSGDYGEDNFFERIKEIERGDY